jgi:hypothetical protein
LKFGATLVLELVTKKQESFDLMAEERYNVLCNGRKIYSNLTQTEYFDVMEDLASDFYQKGSPRPDELETEVIKGD